MRLRWFAIAALAATVGPTLTAGSVRAQQAAPLPPGPPSTKSAAPAPPPPPDQSPWAVIDNGPTGMPPAEYPAATAPATAPHQPFVQWWENRPKPIQEWNENRPKPILTAVENRPKPVLDWYRDYPKNCWSSHNACMCGSTHSELTFIFGSCRDFFGEPCLAGAPRSIYPGDYDYNLNPKLNRRPDGTQPPIPQGSLPAGYPAQGPVGYPPQGYSADGYPPPSPVRGCSRCQ